MTKTFLCETRFHLEENLQNWSVFFKRRINIQIRTHYDDIYFSKLN